MKRPEIRINYMQKFEYNELECDQIHVIVNSADDFLNEKTACSGAVKIRESITLNRFCYLIEALVNSCLRYYMNPENEK